MFEWAKKAWYGKTPEQMSPVSHKKITTTNREDAESASRKAMGRSNKRKMRMQLELYGNPRSNPPTLSLDTRIRQEMRCKDKKKGRMRAMELSKKKKYLEMQINKINGAQENVIRSKDMFDEMDTNKDMANALKMNNVAIKEAKGDLNPDDIADTLDEGVELREDVNEISNSLAFTQETTDDWEADEYLDALEAEMEEEDAGDLLNELISPSNGDTKDRNEDDLIPNVKTGVKY